MDAVAVQNPRAIRTRRRIALLISGKLHHGLGQVFTWALLEHLLIAVAIGNKEDGPAVPRPAMGGAAEAPIIERQAAGRAQAAAIDAKFAHIHVKLDAAFQENKALSVRGECQAIRIEVRPLRQPHRLARGVPGANLDRDCPDAVSEACQLGSGAVAGRKEEAPVLRPAQATAAMHAK